MKRKLKSGLVPTLIDFNEVEIGAIPTTVREEKIKVGIADHHQGGGSFYDEEVIDRG